MSFAIRCSQIWESKEIESSTKSNSPSGAYYHEVTDISTQQANELNFDSFEEEG